MTHQVVLQLLDGGKGNCSPKYFMKTYQVPACSREIHNCWLLIFYYQIISALIVTTHWFCLIINTCLSLSQHVYVGNLYKYVQVLCMLNLQGKNSHSLIIYSGTIFFHAYEVVCKSYSSKSNWETKLQLSMSLPHCHTAIVKSKI